MKPYTILRVARANFPIIQADLYRHYPHFDTMSYAEQQTCYFSEGYTYGNGFSRAMNTLGNVGYDIVCDVKSMQQQWAREHGVHCNEKTWGIDIFLAQLRTYRPDVVYFQGACFAHPLPDLKQKYPFIKLVVQYSGYPRQERDGLDVILVGYPSLVSYYVKQGFSRVEVVYHSFDAAMCPERVAAPTIDFSFVGSSGYGYGASHHSRYWYLRELLQKTNVHLWIYEPIVTTGIQPLPRRFEPMKPLSVMFPERCSHAVSGRAMYAILQQSRLAFNRHPEFAAGEEAGCMRLFEATGVGTCLVTDAGKNLPALFEEDREIVTYSSVDECVEKVHYLLAHEKERAAIAAAGQRRTLRDHTFMRRCEEIDGIIKKCLK